MGKLAYTNRKIEGSKLSQVVVRDIVGFSILVYDFAERTQSKRRPPNSSYKAALRDPVVDFDISSKCVDDEGLQDISQALVEAIKETDSARILILEEVSLRNNNLSTCGLATFAAVVRVSSSEIRSLDLSENSIEIRTSEDVDAWEAFLKSCARCTTLRMLDLSGNKLGQKGFEILSKVWAAEEGVMIQEGTGEAAICGLQSIPYICLANTGLDDVGSAYLSYILENHRFVEELLPLVPQARPGSQTHQLEALDEVEGCNGLVWKPNLELGSLGIKVLELAEMVRISRRDLQDQDVVDLRLTPGVNEIELSSSLQSPARRRSHGNSIISIDKSFHITDSNTSSELVRARSRIQLDVLKNDGLRRNDLWRCAFKMLHCTRVLLFRFDLHVGLGNLGTHHKAPTTPNTTINRIPSQAWPSLPSKPPKPHSTSLTLRLVQPGFQTRKALSKGDPNTSLSTKEPSRKDVNTIMASKSSQGFGRSKTTREHGFIGLLRANTREKYAALYRTNLPAGFPEDVWTNIIAYATDAHGVLSDNQKNSVVRWGASRDSMKELQTLMGKHESQQLYKALEGMGCLAYSI